MAKEEVISKEATKKVNKKSTTIKETKTKVVEKKDNKSAKEKTTKKPSTVKKEVSTKKSNSTKTTTSKKEPSKKTTSVKKTSSKKSTKTKSNLNQPTAKTMLAEYYDLPYRYNQTIVKILAQTPTTLFVYWDISDEDRNSLISSYGENFFSETRPILIIHNLTHNYSFEIEINDFANSWYIRTQEPNCNYIIELGRKYNNLQNEYVYINSSNNMVSPNDHILFENINLGNVLFKNIKTNVFSSHDFCSLSSMNAMNKLYGNIYDVYSNLYNDELFNELTNPSSGEFYLKK